MFHKACKLSFGKGTVLRVTFQDGSVMEYDISVLYSKYTQLRALNDRKLFKSGKLMGGLRNNME